MDWEKTGIKLLKYAPLILWSMLHIANTMGIFSTDGTIAAIYFLFTFSLPGTLVILVFYKWLFPLYLKRQASKKSKIRFYFMLEIVILGTALIGHVYTPDVFDISLSFEFPMATRITVIVSVTLIGVVLAASLLMSEHHYQSKINKIELMADKVKAELDVLKNQINPHFLFNTLNNIYGMAYMGNKNAAKMISKLSQIMRYMLDEGQADKVLLLKERELIENYLALQGLKNESLNIDFYTDGIEGVQLVPPMILINFVENCFQHSDLDNNPKAWLKIGLEVNDGLLNFNTENSFEKGKEQTNRTGIGINNSRKLLNGYYPENHSLIIDHRNGIHKVDLTIQL